MIEAPFNLSSLHLDDGQQYSIFDLFGYASREDIAVNSYNYYVGINKELEEFYTCTYDTTLSEIANLHFMAPFYTSSTCSNPRLVPYGVFRIENLVNWVTGEVTSYNFSLNVFDIDGNEIPVTIVNSSLGFPAPSSIADPLNERLGKNLSPIYGVVAGTAEHPTEVFLGRFGSILIGAMTSPNYQLEDTDSNYMVFPTSSSNRFNVAFPVGNVTIDNLSSDPTPAPDTPPPPPPEFDEELNPQPEGMDFKALYAEYLTLCWEAANAAWTTYFAEGGTMESSSVGGTARTPEQQKTDVLTMLVKVAMQGFNAWCNNPDRPFPVITINNGG